MKSHITVFLPGLLGPFLRQISSHDAPSLAILLCRASRKVGPNTFETSLQSFFKGLIAPVPSAALCALAKGIINIHDKRHWFLMSPVECFVNHQTAYVLGCEQLALTPPEIESLFSLLSEFVSQEGITMTPSALLPWLCTLENHTDIAMNDIDQIMNKDMYPLLPSGKDKSYWHRLLTQVQMLLESSLVNKQRFKENKPLVSSVWFWGMGQLPKRLSTQFSLIFTNNDVISGLGLLSNKPVKTIPISTDLTADKDEVLIADLSFYSYVQHQTFEPWYDLLINYEQSLFSPLLKDLKQGNIRKISFICADGVTYDVTKTTLKYFWRKIMPLALLENKNKNDYTATT